MDYEKKYKDALQRAKHALDCHDQGMVSTDVSLITSMFPELKESEDERIRKALKEYFINSFQNNGVAAICGVHIIDILTWLEKQGEAYTKRDVDDAWLEGMCDAKRELEKQGDSPIKWNKNTKDCKPKVCHSVLMKTTHGIAEGEWQGEQWHQYRWAALVRDVDVLSWIELSDLEKRTYEQ